MANEGVREVLLFSFSALAKARNVWWGYDVLAAGEAGQLGQADREQLNYARHQGRVLLTHNRNDFLALAKGYAQQALPHAGILYIPQVPYRELFRRMLKFFAIATRAQVENVFIGIP
jgi:Domain of unknown function (DUF5615)